MNRCFSTLLALVNSGQPCVLVTVAHIAGSAPREPGARMIVTAAETTGTIGGGNLEYEAIRIARSRLGETPATRAQRFMELFPLGPMLQQCCGGAVFLHFEVLADAVPAWIASAAEMEQGNTRAVLASRTPPSPSSFPVSRTPPSPSSFPVSGTPPSPSSFPVSGTPPSPPSFPVSRTPPSPPSFPRRRESSKTTSAESGPYIDTGKLPVTEKMIFTETGVTGSLGDKRLDELATQKAGALLSADAAPESVLLHPLTETQSILPDTSNALFFEVVSPAGFHVVLFGAGHVGRALVNVLAGATDCRITWVDGRAGQFPAELPSNVEARFTGNPVAEAENLPARACCLVMTHDHQLDQDLCEALLRRNDLAFIGLIGSATKQRRFAQRLREKGITERQLERLTCPIGIPGIDSKEPGAIAISVAAQLLEIKSADDAD